VPGFRSVHAQFLARPDGFAAQVIPALQLADGDVVAAGNRPKRFAPANDMGTSGIRARP